MPAIPGHGNGPLSSFPPAPHRGASPDAFLSDLIANDEPGVTAEFAALRSTLRSNPTPDQLLERLAADGQTAPAASLLAAWQAGAVPL